MTAPCEAAIGMEVAVRRIKSWEPTNLGLHRFAARGRPQTTPKTHTQTQIAAPFEAAIGMEVAVRRIKSWEPTNLGLHRFAARSRPQRTPKTQYPIPKPKWQPLAKLPSVKSTTIVVSSTQETKPLVCKYP